MMIVKPCMHEGCGTLTIGDVCMSHALGVAQTFPRGRPFDGAPVATHEPAPPSADHHARPPGNGLAGNTRVSA
jgi:hypothetical protein